MSRLDRIFFANTRADAAAIGFDDSHIYDEIPLPLEHRSVPMRRLLKRDALAVFREWDRMPNKVPY